MANERCAGCGGVLAIIGRVHRCSGHLLKAAKVEAITPPSSTYRYRDTAQRRAYMRGLMKRKYVPKKSSGGAAKEASDG